MTKETLIALYSPTSELQPPSSNPDAEQVRLSELPEDSQYGLVVVECA